MPLILTYFIDESDFFLKLPIFNGTVTVNWGDGDTNSLRTHTYLVLGNYTVTVNGSGVTKLSYKPTDLATGNNYLIECTSFGEIGLIDLSYAFYNTPNLTIVPTTLPTGSNILNMSNMFQLATSFNQDISDWNVSTVQNMSNMFKNATEFNQNISSWNVSNVQDMSSMFQNATAFNKTLNSWTVSSVLNMSSMFRNATVFNQDISGWTVSSVLNMSNMFLSATAFNQDISGWTVSSVTNMSSMFQNTTAFNSPLNSWTVSSVTNMNSMFQNATVFNQDISGWTVSSVTNMTNMFNSATLFNSPLNSWNVLNVQDMSSMFQNAVSFNQDISGWNVSAVINMSGMFVNAELFNQPLNGWDVSSVINMSSMFLGATSFNQPLNGWDVSSVQIMNSMLSNTDLSINNYNSLLSGWSLLTLQPDVNFGVGGLIYTSAGSSGRNTLITPTNNWIISGDAFQQPDIVIQTIPFSLSCYNAYNNGSNYQLYLNDLSQPFSDIITFDGTNNPLVFTNLISTGTGIITVILYNNSDLTTLETYYINISPAPPPIVCFKEGSKILTDKGYICIQDLQKGDLVKTLKHEYKSINMIGKREIYNLSLKDRIKDQLYKCSNEQFPEVFEPLIITGCHAILIDNCVTHKQIEQTKEVLGNTYFTDDKYRMPACIDERTTVYEVEGKFMIYHIALDCDDYYMNYGIYANGLLVETCSKRYLKELSNMELINL